MLRGNRLYVLAIGLVCASFMVLSWWLLPTPPSFSTHKQVPAPKSDYQPGGSGCKPEALRQLSGDESVAKRDACADAAEQYRLNTQDLVQQTRAADGAQVGAIISYQGFLVSYLGAIVSFFTLVTAIAAVWFAKKASDTADRSVKIAIETSQAELRAYFGSTQEAVEFDNEEKSSGIIILQLTNRGVTPAHSAVADFDCHVRHENGGIDNIIGGQFILGTIPPSVHSDMRSDFKLAEEHVSAIGKNKAILAVSYEVRYIDSFGKKWIYYQTLGIDREALDGGLVKTLECHQAEQHDNADAQDESPRLPGM